MVESVEYTVEETFDGVEIRRYPRMILATVYGLPDDDAFSMLFSYISGQNTSQRRIAMTVPVVSAERGERIPMTAPVIAKGSSFSFVLPAEFTAETAPRPVDDRIRLEEIQQRRVAVLRFRGSTSEPKIRERTRELMVALGRKNLVASDEPFLMRYNPPFVPGIFRRNEIGAELAD